ncbi:Carboxylesterase type B [Penicillium taxi]|uniref:Carboxylesterase type B n=1 Tax=Penicillium taxi TaxID=168475 RepID=UPI0025458952|nr:Carboxylesterase type B [Penicillium taxi]KAJ5887952.1 Carboxylesterase type B [Penicillium taxi]
MLKFQDVSDGLNQHHRHGQSVVGMVQNLGHSILSPLETFILFLYPNDHGVPFPPDSPDLEKKLPVMVFLHGGAFTYAAGSAGMYDGRVLADISRDDEKTPTIIVTLNYRLGVLGFLASEEIREYNKSHGEDGVGNYGLWDQVEALRWIQKHISAFGGDPDRVTLFGQSAGGVATNIHLLRDEPLFSGAILQSGLLPLCGIMTVEQYQVIYEKTLQVLGISSDLPPKERLEQLLKVDESRITASMVDVFMTPVVTLAPCDDHFLINGPMPSWSDFGNFKTPSWCKRIMIGDAKNECIIWNKAYRDIPSSNLLSRCESVVGLETAQKLLDIYNITPTMSPTETFYAIEKFTTDGMYLAINYDAMRAAPECFAYHFDEPSPYDNEWGGLAHHSFENIFIWSVLRHTLPPSQQEQSKRMAALWLKFGQGQDPWPKFGKNENIMIFENGQANLKTPTEDAERGYGKWSQIQKEGLQEEFGKLADDLCILRGDLLNPDVQPIPVAVSDIVPIARRTGEVGIL